MHERIKNLRDSEREFLGGGWEEKIQPPISQIFTHVRALTHTYAQYIKSILALRGMEGYVLEQIFIIFWDFCGENRNW